MDFSHEITKIISIIYYGFDMVQSYLLYGRKKTQEQRYQQEFGKEAKGQHIMTALVIVYQH